MPRLELALFSRRLKGRNHQQWLKSDRYCSSLRYAFATLDLTTADSHDLFFGPRLVYAVKKQAMR